MAEKFDAILFELFKNAVFSITDEMALTLFRTTYSGVLKDNMDYSTGFADVDGKLAAQGLTIPGHLGSVPTAMDSITRHFRDDIAPGDVFIMNDPFDGGMHLPDILSSSRCFRGASGSPSPARSVTTPTSAAASQDRMHRIRPKFMPRDCASPP